MLATLSAEQKQPKTLRKLSDTTFLIVWKDGHGSKFPILYLRRLCPVQVAQSNDMVGKMFTLYLAQADSVMHLDLSFRKIFVQSTFSLLVGTLSNLHGAMVIRLAFILLKHCGKSVLVQSVLHYGIPNEISR